LKEADIARSWKWFIRILRKILVTLFLYLEPARVDLITNTMTPMAMMKIKISLIILLIFSGHFPHLKSSVLEYPGLHSVQSIPLYPTSQDPIGL
jgi:hypothetical protein